MEDRIRAFYVVIRLEGIDYLDRIGAFARKDVIDTPECKQHADSGLYGKDRPGGPFIDVFVRCDRYNKYITLSFGPLKMPYMPEVEDIEDAVAQTDGWCTDSSEVR